MSFSCGSSNEEKKGSAEFVLGAMYKGSLADIRVAGGWFVCMAKRRECWVNPIQKDRSSSLC